MLRQILVLNYFTVVLFACKAQTGSESRDMRRPGPSKSSNGDSRDSKYDNFEFSGSCFAQTYVMGSVPERFEDDYCVEEFN